MMINPIGINPQQATAICESLVNLLAEWPELNIALQSGGLEVKATALIAQALRPVVDNLGLQLLREYRYADFAMIVPPAHYPQVQPNLTVASVVEVKFNYAGQIGEILNRVPKGVDQADAYRARLHADSAYLLYFIAAPQIPQVPPAPRDSGWGYWNSPMPPAVQALQAAAEGVHAPILADASVDLPCQICCFLIESPGAAL